MAKKKVLIALDGSEFSRAILQFICRDLGPEHFEAIVFHVAEPPSLGAVTPRHAVLVHDVLVPGYESWVPRGYATPDNADLEVVTFASQIWEARTTELTEQMIDEARPLKEAGFTVSVEIRFGDPGAEIIGFVEHEGVDLVAMTTHGRTGLRRLVLGSVAEHVLCRVPVPVMLVRPFQDALEGEHDAATLD